MNDCLFEAQLPDLLSGSLSDADELQLNRHLEGCVHCRHALDRATLVPECLCAPPSRHRDDSHDRAPGIDPLLQALKDRTPELNDKRGVSLSRAGDIEIDSTAQSDGEPDSHLPEIPGYEVLSEISRGGMGVIYKARQLVPNRIVAVKMTKSGRFANREEIQRFQTEAAAAATLEHPHIVPIFEVGKSDGCHFYSMGFVDGCTLQDQLRGGPLAITAAAELGKTIAETVQFAHENGIVHRDLKPSNILIDQEGKPRIADFGLAKNTAVESGLTATGQILGTPSFMSPEQASGKLEDAGLRSTRIRLFNSHQVTIPNDELARSDIENVGRRLHIRRVADFQIPLDTSHSQLLEAVSIIEGHLADHEGMHPDYPPRVFFLGFLPNAFTIRMMYWYHPPDYWDYLAFSDKLNSAIFRDFEESGIGFSLPDRVAHTSLDGQQSVNELPVVGLSGHANPGPQRSAGHNTD